MCYLLYNFISHCSWLVRIYCNVSPNFKKTSMMESWTLCLSGSLNSSSHFKLHNNTRGCRQRLCEFSSFWSASKKRRVKGTRVWAAYYVVLFVNWWPVDELAAELYTGGFVDHALLGSLLPGPVTASGLVTASLCHAVFIVYFHFIHTNTKASG